MSVQTDKEWGWDEDDEEENYQYQERDHELEEELGEQDAGIPTLTDKEALFKNFTDVLPDNHDYLEFINNEIIPIQTLRGLNRARLAEAYMEMFGGTPGRGCGCDKTNKDDTQTQEVNSCVAYMIIIEKYKNKRP